MKSIKISNVAVALLASTSFYAAAETIVPGSAVTVEADIVVSAGSAIGLEVIPAQGLTVGKLLDEATKLATLKVTGNNAAIRLINADPTATHCAWVNGVNNNTNKVQMCLNQSNGPLTIGGVRYWKYAAGEHGLHPGTSNSNAGLAKLGADTYKVSLEAIQYNP